MASIGNDPGGRRRILFVGMDGKRHTIRLGKMPKRSAEDVKRRVEALIAAQISRSEDAGSLWRSIRDVTPLAGQKGDIWRLSVQPSRAPDLLGLMPTGSRTLLDWGGGRIWALVPEGTDLRAHLGAFAGYASLLRSDAALSFFGSKV